jgi:hypothetical protein
MVTRWIHAAIPAMLAISAAHAFAAPLDPAICSGNAEAGFEAPFNQVVQSLQCGLLTATFTNPPITQIPFEPPGNGTGRSAIVLSGLSVTTSASAGGFSAAGGSAQVTAFFEVTGPSAVNGVPVTEVPMLLTVTGTTETASCNGACNKAQSDARFDLADPGTLVQFCADTQSGFSGPPVFGGCDSVNNGAAFSAIDQSVLVPPNVEGQITMSAFADISVPFVPNGTGNAAASVDPILTIDPSFQFANDFQIEFSPGVGGASAAPEPLPVLLVPAALAVMGGFRARARRRRRPRIQSRIT